MVSRAQELRSLGCVGAAVTMVFSDLFGLLKRLGGNSHRLFRASLSSSGGECVANSRWMCKISCLWDGGC